MQWLPFLFTASPLGGEHSSIPQRQIYWAAQIHSCQQHTSAHGVPLQCSRQGKFPFFFLKIGFLWSFSHNRLMIGLTINPCNAEATFVQNTRAQRPLKTIYKLRHAGIYWTALAELYQMSTNVPGFQSFLTFLNYYIFVQISHQQKRG